MKLKSSMGPGFVNVIRVYSDVACEMKISVFVNPDKLQPIQHTDKLTGNEVCYRNDEDLLIHITPQTWSFKEGRFYFKVHTRLMGDHFMMYVVTNDVKVSYGVLDGEFVDDVFLLEIGPCVFEVSPPRMTHLKPLDIYNKWARTKTFDDDIDWLEKATKRTWGSSPVSDIDCIDI